MEITDYSIKSLSSNTVRNVIGGFLAGYGWVSFFCFLYLVSDWASRAPKIPDAARGIIFQHNDHGWITYFSGFQGTSLYVLFCSSIPLFFLGVGIIPKKNVKSKFGRLSFGMTYERDDPHKISKWGLLTGAIAAPSLIYLMGPMAIHGLNGLGFVVGF